jgi:DNA-binding HxlR family transcriptional regulator
MTGLKSPSRFPRELLLVRPGKWDLVVIASLKSGTLRFNALRAEIGGISQKVLTSTLRELERDGFISRTQYPSIPPRVEYALTELGHELLVYVETWVGFVRTNRVAVMSAREAFDREHGCEPDHKQRAS